MSTFTNSEDPDEMQHNAALYWEVKVKGSSPPHMEIHMTHHLLFSRPLSWPFFWAVP